MNNELLATSGEDRKAKIWNLQSRQLVKEFKHANFVTQVLPTNHGTLLSCSYDGEIREHQLS